MDRRSRSLVTRVGIGVAGLTAAAAIVIPLQASKPPQPENVRSRPASHVEPAPQPATTSADPGCVTVDANGVPLYDSQYEQRTGHPPC
jgi:hypothetical protein